MHSWSMRLRIGCLLIGVFGSLASFYFEYVVGLTPCPLCIMQRCMVLLITFVGLGSLLLRRWWRHCVWLGLLFALAGVYFAWRQSYLQGLPPELAPSCGPSLYALMRYFPLQALLKALFWGSGSCAQQSWQWLGLSMANWSLVMFMILAALYLKVILLLSKPHV